MYNSIPGIIDAFEIIQKSKATENSLDVKSTSIHANRNTNNNSNNQNLQVSKTKTKHVIKKKTNPIPNKTTTISNETLVIDEEARMKLLLKSQTANQYYSEIENCTARIQAKLREIDQIDLIHNNNQENGLIMNENTKEDIMNQEHNMNKDYESSKLKQQQSNHRFFLDTQCERAQTLLSSQYYLSHLNTSDILSSISEIDEHINTSARNFKFSLIDYGIDEKLLSDHPTDQRLVHTEPLTSINNNTNSSSDNNNTTATNSNDKSIENTNATNITLLKSMTTSSNANNRDSRVRRNSILLKRKVILVVLVINILQNTLIIMMMNLRN